MREGVLFVLFTVILQPNVSSLQQIVKKYALSESWNSEDVLGSAV